MAIECMHVQVARCLSHPPIAFFLIPLCLLLSLDKFSQYKPNSAMATRMLYHYLSFFLSFILVFILLDFELPRLSIASAGAIRINYPQHSYY
ncbi:hypothetical protein DFH27DRAFT_566770, partial [Peziza echinospora]